MGMITVPAARRAAAALLALLVALAARADAPPGARMLELRSGSITYTLVHKLHRVQGTCQKLEGRALVLPDGSAKVQVRAPLASFDSGNSNRDAHMREATHELQHPHVTVKGTMTGFSLPLGAAAEKTLQATVELNGERRTLPVQVQLSPEGDKVRARFAFLVSLDAFKIERPELLLIKVDDEVKLEGELLFEEAR
jgi:polyisoprenoid-binding protein YceI